MRGSPTSFVGIASTTRCDVSWLDDMEAPGLRLRAKRALDVALAGGGLVALAPLLGGLTVVQQVVHGWPPFFVHDRPGFRGKLFKLVKFRTMTNARGADGALLPDAERLTRFGQWMRAASVDELPELLNVLKGEMSLVGPRPLMPAYLERYSPTQARRHEMPPGITGWAQIHGRNAIGWDEKFELDVWYVDHWSLALDLRILLSTIHKVLSQEGISAQGDATMPEFIGPSPTQACEERT